LTLEIIDREPVIEVGLDFILGHFPTEEPLWPRTISTHTTERRQIPVCNKEEVLARFKQANFLDSRISAYPDYTQWHGVNRQAPNFIFIDLDLSRFNCRETLDRALGKTLKNIKAKLGGGYPSVLHSGNGYHILQPIDAFILESERMFATFKNTSMKFLRFAEPYLTNNKADPCYSNSLSFKNCMLRIPGSHNSRCLQRNNGVADTSTEVKIIQRWDGKRPAINWLLLDFRRYLIQEKINDTFKNAKLKKKRSVYYTTNRSINWIESLLETSIEDYRKFVMWRILAPYLINIKKLCYDEAFTVIKDWLKECGEMKPLDFNANNRIKDNLKAAMKVGYLPISLNALKKENRKLYDVIIIIVPKDFRNRLRKIE
jgi:hypothetical protein